MARNFKVKGVQFEIVDVPLSHNVTEQRYKYDVMIFNSKKGYWSRLCGCKTLAEGKEKAKDHMEGIIIDYT